VGRENRATITVEHIRQAKEAWLIVFDRRDKSRSPPWDGGPTYQAAHAQKQLCYF